MSYDEDKKDTGEDKTPEKQPKHRRQWRRSKPRHGENSNTDMGDNSTPDDAEDNKDPVEPTSEQDEQKDGQVSPNEQAILGDSKDSKYLPLFEEEESLGDEDFIVPEEPLEQERFKRRLIAIARSLRKKNKTATRRPV